MKNLHIFYFDGTDRGLELMHSIYCSARSNAVIFTDINLSPADQERLKNNLNAYWAEVPIIRISLTNDMLLNTIEISIKDAFEQYYGVMPESDFECHYYLDTAPSVFTYYMLRLMRKYNVVLFKEPYLTPLEPLGSTRFDEFKIHLLNIAYYQCQYNSQCFSIKNAFVDMIDMMDRGIIKPNVNRSRNFNKLSHKIKLSIDELIADGMIEVLSDQEYAVISSSIGRYITSLRAKLGISDYSDESFLQHFSEYSEFNAGVSGYFSGNGTKFNHFVKKACGGDNLYRLTKDGESFCVNEKILSSTAHLYSLGHPMPSIRNVSVAESASKLQS